MTEVTEIDLAAAKVRREGYQVEYVPEGDGYWRVQFPGKPEQKLTNKELLKKAKRH